VTTDDNINISAVNVGLIARDFYAVYKERWHIFVLSDYFLTLRAAKKRLDLYKSLWRNLGVCPVSTDSIMFLPVSLCPPITVNR